MKYSLRSLMIVVTVVCCVAWFVVLVLSDLRNTLEYTRKRAKETEEAIQREQTRSLPTPQTPTQNPANP